MTVEASEFMRPDETDTVDLWVFAHRDAVTNGVLERFDRNGDSLSYPMPYVQAKSLAFEYADEYGGRVRCGDSA